LNCRSQEKENEDLTLNRVIAVGSISIGYGIVIELTQLFFTKTRSAELLDVLANTLGFIISVIAYSVVKKMLYFFNFKK
jgi:VanZ family protein